MIQTKDPLLQNRNGVMSIIKIEVRPDERTATGRKFLVIDWNMANTENAHFSKYVHWTNEQIDATEAYIEVTYAEDLVGLTREEREYKKLAIALMLDTQTNLFPDGTTIYGKQPEDWEFSPILTPTE